MTTAKDLIEGAMKDLGALALEEGAEAAEVAEGLVSLNNLLDTLTTESLMVYSVQQHIFNLVAGQSAYTIGTGGDFNISRPVKIQDCYIRDVNNNDFPVNLITQEQYSLIVSKTVQSAIPTLAWDNQDFPLKTLTFWPVPNDANYRAVLWTWELLSQFSSASDTVVLPPGYQRMLRSNLALEIAPVYGREPPPSLVKIATESKAQIKRNNAVSWKMSFDPALTRKGGRYNWINFLRGD